jgi:hypothetical protein
LITGFNRFGWPLEETQMRHFKMVQLALAVLAFLISAPGLASAAPAHHVTGAHLRFAHIGLHYARGGSRHGHGYHHQAHLAALVGNRESGLGFYPPTGPYYPHAWRRWQQRNAIRDAVDSQAVYGYYGIGGGYPGERHAHNMFNPIDGYGSPFFAGYYGPAGDPDEDRGLFGNAYRD